ncbi:ATPases involved in chromosome partitioning [Geoglobus ahangari]|uniref:Iron-sulfur cluster carrier protein n=1 Tax=Geoglobus ahangari TaxID=113653 RepID=A0A0F7IE66_9EURY|nr:Mrp/NBP35 family ATP-binding protein [Geoglobus ahangari]AKG91795.1 ATPases involved in chromosome partitioning [Geoglobus ahangari]
MHQTVSDQEIEEKLSSVKKKIAIMSGKGGVGKSTVTALLAIHLAKKGNRVAILDTDFLGPSIPKLFGLDSANVGFTDKGIEPPVTKKYGIKVLSIQFLLPDSSTPVIWRGPMITGVMKDLLGKTDWGELDYLLFDLPPGTGDAPLTLMQTVKLDGVVMVASPTELTSLIVEKALNMARMMNTEVSGIVENMSYFRCPHCGEISYIFGRDKAKRLAEKYGLKVIAEIPVDPELAELSDVGEIESYERDYFEDVSL